MYQGTEIVNNGPNIADYYCYVYGIRFTKERVLRERHERPRVAL